MACNGLLGFLDGPVKIGFTEFTATLVANSVEGNHLGEIVFVALFFFQATVNIRLCTIIIGVIPGIERMPPT